MDEAVLLLNKTISFMLTELVKTKGDIMKTGTALDGYKEQANRDATKIQQAHNESVVAGNLASKAQNDLSIALADVENLMIEVEALGSIDLAALEAVEERFAKAKNTIENKITVEIDSLQKKVVEQKLTITNYELDLGPLRKEVAGAVTLFNGIPMKCFKVDPAFEQGIIG